MSSAVSRRLRRATLSLLPPGQRARIREWYQSAAAPRQRASASLVPDGAALSVRVSDGPEFLIPSEIREDIEIHFTNAEHAAEVSAFLRETVSPGILFDVGANNGLFSLLFCQVHSANRAFGYEPSPLFAGRAEAIARLNGLDDRIQIVLRAVADTENPRELLVDEQTGRVQARQFAGTAREGWVSRSLAATTLDAEAARVGTPSIVKIDVEGDELEVLQGAARLLEHGRPVVMLELHLNFLEERRIAVPDVSGLLTRRGYELFDISGRPLSQRRLARSWASVVHVVARPAR